MMKLHHLCIQTNDYPKSLDFYTNILGFELIHETMNFHGRQYNSWLKLDDFMIELQTGKMDEDLIPCHKSSQGIAHLCFLIENVETEYQRLTRLNFHEFLPKNGEVIYQVCGSKLLKLTAPEGTIIEMRDTQEV